MKIKDDFILGILASVFVFMLIYSVIVLLSSVSFFSNDADNMWIYMLSLFPNLLLARFMLVKWEMERTGKGMLFFTLIGIVVVMFVVLK